MPNLSKTFHYGKDRRHFSFSFFLLLTLYNFLDSLWLSSCFTHSLSLKKPFFSSHFNCFFPFEYSSLFLLLYVPENIRLITSVCAHMEERQSVCERYSCLLYMYYKAVCKYFTSRSWTFDKNLYKTTAESTSIWDKSFILRSPTQNCFL